MRDLTRPLWSHFDLDGSASRKRAWTIFAVLIGTLLLAQLFRANNLNGVSAVFLAVGLASILWVVALVQRLHATGRSGYWALLSLVPYAGVLASVVILCLPPRDVVRRGHPIARRIGAAALVVLGLLFLSRALFWQPYWIPSENMKPTLLVGDFLVATKVGRTALQRGDVVVFRHPVHGTDFIKRLVGLPGDTVQMRGGVLYINGEAAMQEAAGEFDEIFEPQGPMRNRPRCENGPVSEGEICSKSRLVETLPGGRSYSILNIETEAFADDTDRFTVPEGFYFVLGDNRDNSNDSRFPQVAGGVGFVPAENIHSRAWVILFSSAGRMIADVRAWRSDRFLVAVE